MAKLLEHSASENAELKDRLERLERQTVDLFTRKYRGVAGGQFKGSAYTPKVDPDTEPLRKKLEKKTRENTALRRDLDNTLLERGELEEELADLRKLSSSLKIGWSQRPEVGPMAAASCQTESQTPRAREVREVEVATIPLLGVPAVTQTAWPAPEMACQTDSAVIAVDAEAATSPRPRISTATQASLEAKAVERPVTCDAASQFAAQADDADTQTVLETSDAEAQACDETSAVRILELEQALSQAGEAVRVALAEREGLRADLKRLEQEVAAAKKAQAAETKKAQEAADSAKSALSRLEAAETRNRALEEALAEEKANSARWQARCKEALTADVTKVLVSCPKVTLALGEKELEIYGQMDLEDVGKFIRATLLPKYTSILAIEAGKGEDIHQIVESLCNSLVQDIGDTLKKKAPSVNVNARRLSRSESKSTLQSKSKEI